MHEADWSTPVLEPPTRTDRGSAQPRLNRCQQLLNKLDPDRPPPDVQPKEFRWQYLALRERVHVYTQCLADADGPPHQPDSALVKAEFAIGMSLRYFHDAFSQKHDVEDDSNGNVA